MFYSLFQSLASRGYIAFIFTFFILLACGNKIIKFLKKTQNHGQPIRKDGPSTHEVKSGTPTMGGIFIFLFTILSILLFCNLKSMIVWILVFTIFAFCMIGFLDDYLKIKHKNHNGISAKTKYLLQIIGSVIVLLFIYMYFDSNASSDMFFKVKIPFLNGDYILNLGYIYPVFAIFVITGTSNAVNLTDGIDSLVSSLSIMNLIFLAIYAYFFKSSLSYLDKDIYEIIIFCIILSSALIVFNWHNSFPASIFMGDVGSLAIGAIIATLVVLLKCEILLVFTGIIFVLEAMSVILQVLYFKFTRGKRIFLMAPLHHHYEKKGLKETKIVSRFCMFNLLVIIIISYFLFI